MSNKEQTEGSPKRNHKTEMGISTFASIRARIIFMSMGGNYDRRHDIDHYF